MSIKNSFQISLPRTCRINRNDSCGSWSKCFIFLSFILINISCATISHVSAEGEFPAVYPLIENINPQWQHFTGGVGYFHGKTENPRLEFWAIKVDLRAENISIVTGAGAANSGSSLSTRVSSFVRGNNLVAGINALPFDINTTAEGQPIQNIGIVISNGALLSPANRYYDALVFYKTEDHDEAAPRAAIVSQSSIGSAENIENAVGGFHKILAGGNPAQRTVNNDARHPRSAAGVSTNGDFLYLLVIDGRRTGSVGSTERETALILSALGSHNGINLDGGGSSALAMRFQDGIVRTVNTPVNIFPGQERAVAGCIGIRAD